MENYVLLSVVALAYGVSFDDRIIGGGDAKPGQFPFVCAILVKNDLTCSGTIVNKRWIITAAHCLDDVNPADIVIKAGIIDLKDSTGQTFTVEKVVIHPDFAENDRVVETNDICLVKLNKDIVFNTKVKLIAPYYPPIPPDRVAIFCGWGDKDTRGTSPAKLQWLEVKIIKMEDCGLLYPEVELIYNRVCTMKAKGIGACLKDAGSPLILGTNFIGIMSWGTPCALGLPDVFTRISVFAAWIDKTMI